MNSKKRILVAPLNWGLGHATRCIPIIEALIGKGFEPFIAGDGESLLLLEKEFPQLKSIKLPSYGIRYPKNGKFLKMKLLTDSPKVIKAIRSEKKQIESLVSSGKIDGIISDNRFGIVDERVPSVMVTHQLRVLSGQTSWLSTKIHQKFINSFDECWVPDMPGKTNLSGVLGHENSLAVPVKYLGILSRFKFKSLTIKYDLIVVLSGPETQRSLLEVILLEKLKSFDGRVLIIQGKLEQKQMRKQVNNILLVNFMLADELESSIAESRMVLARSGYTTLMDLAVLKKKAFFIPTPGQYEQLYLAEYMEDRKIAPFCHQDDFSLSHLNKVSEYNGFENFTTASYIRDRLSFFEGK